MKANCFVYSHSNNYAHPKIGTRKNECLIQQQQQQKIKNKKKGERTTARGMEMDQKSQS